MDPIKFEQIAYYTVQPEIALLHLEQKFGMKKWVHDTCMADGLVFGKPVTGVVGELWFNYDTPGMEFELLHYPGKDNWHAARGAFPGPMFLSHMGYHVPDMAVARVRFERMGWKVAQEVRTTYHSNPYLQERGRTYHYVVWDSLHIIGFDLKLIQRVEGSL